ncbi:MAG: metallophosphoesterase [Kiritimatiellae bacterium]|nr:metallophosphoesterase [Kiritimatiellia bacterium]MDD5519788.1 metallophosphoesterase [Kiritimatiellia bacterium]
MKRRGIVLGMFVIMLWMVRTAGAFIFIHISDPHVNVTETGRFREEGLANLRRAIAAIRVIKPAFVIVTGDVTELGDEASFASYRAEINRAGIPVYTVQGNHDTPGNPVIFNRTVGPTHSVFDFEDCRFVGLNFDRAEEALTLLESQLTSGHTAGIKHIFTFAHYPLMVPDSVGFGLNAGFFSIRGETATRYLTLAQRFHIVAHFAGHLHGQFDIADPYTGIPSLAVPACVDRNAAFRICSVNNGVVNWSVSNADKWPVAVLESARPHMQWGTTCLEGTNVVRILTFGPHVLKNAEVRLANKVLVSQLSQATNAIPVVIDCNTFSSGSYELRVHLVDAANNRSDWNWRLLIKGGKQAERIPTPK